MTRCDRSVVSVVLPVYNERDNLASLLDEIVTVLGSTSHEIVAVDDGSTDGSLAELRQLRRRHPQLRLVAFAGNAGQSAAIVAGFDAARGEVVVTMDADGQNDPADLPALVGALDADPGLAAVVGYRVSRTDTPWKLLQSRVANAVRNWLTTEAVRDTGCSLKAMRRSALGHLPRFNGMHRFLATLISLGGGKVIELPVSHRPRQYGGSKYGMWNRVFRGIRDAMGVRWLRRRSLRYVIREDIG